MDEERAKTPELPKPELEPEIRHGPSFSWLTCPCAVFFVYFLSIGPMARYYPTRPVPKSAETFYAPIVYLGKIAPPVGRFLVWYVDKLWLGSAPPYVPPAYVPPAPRPTYSLPTNTPPGGTSGK